MCVCVYTQYKITMRYNNINTFIHPTFHVLFIKSQSCVTIGVYDTHNIYIYLCKSAKKEGQWTYAQ